MPQTSIEVVKLGLALSGGGFRASFFHIGVLAQMAMQGLLRHVEVISTVSGGSIIGALYYLHVKRLLESKVDEEITDQDYQRLVEQIEVDFFAAVQRNFRMSTFADWRANLQMRRSDYSRSDRIAELYNDLLYQPVQSGASSPIQMRELKIRPKGSSMEFHPEKDNTRRRAKVPILLINATTLNTGHNWRFTASRMGEPPREDSLAKEIDKKAVRLRRPPSYDTIVTHQQDFPLGHAVAASACVPAIFHPLAISGLYHDLRVQLVDGGVHDNQGIQGLLDEDCTHFIVSDASQQMEEEEEPATDIGSVIRRSDDIFQDRLREEQLFRLFEGKERSRVAFMHLRKGLPAKAVAWLSPDGQPAEEPRVEPPEFPSENFHVDQRVQNLLSKIRTDLDSFTEVEAYSLMLDCYFMSQSELRKLSDVLEINANRVVVDVARWKFLKIAPWMANPNDSYLKQLEVASEQLLKVFHLLWPKWLMNVMLLTVLLIPAFLSWLLRNVMFSVGMLLFAGIVLAVGYSNPRLARAFKLFRFFRSPIDTMARFVGRALIPVIGSLFVRIHLKFFDPLFLQQGKLERLKPPS
ncbi:MAG: patatin-like phospholipase family protein [Candidatus Tectomicrobia bacterium]|nr:patatin-like phospholipase family protein [Candidatus Tectomicrobia bacterium]